MTSHCGCEGVPTPCLVGFILPHFLHFPLSQTDFQVPHWGFTSSVPSSHRMSRSSTFLRVAPECSSCIHCSWCMGGFLRVTHVVWCCCFCLRNLWQMALTVYSLRPSLINLQRLAVLLKSKRPEDLQEANWLIKNMVKEVSVRTTWAKFTPFSSLHALNTMWRMSLNFAIFKCDN